MADRDASAQVDVHVAKKLTSVPAQPTVRWSPSCSGLRAERSRLQLDLAEAPRAAGLTTYGYRLHAVLIHSGEAGSGHYWAYVHDTPTGNWYRFNDTTVTLVDQSEVYASSFGGDGLRSAYGLVYVSAHSPENANSGCGAGYAALHSDWAVVSEAAKQFVEHDNAVLSQERQRWADQQGRAEPPAAVTGAEAEADVMAPAPSPVAMVISAPASDAFSPETQAHTQSQAQSSVAGEFATSATASHHPPPTIGATVSPPADLPLELQLVFGEPPLDLMQDSWDAGTLAQARADLLKPSDNLFLDRRLCRYLPLRGSGSRAVGRGHGQNTTAGTSPTKKAVASRSLGEGGHSFAHFTVSYLDERSLDVTALQSPRGEILASLKQHFRRLYRWASYVCSALESFQSSLGQRRIVSLQLLATAYCLRPYLRPPGEPTSECDSFLCVILDDFAKVGAHAARQRCDRDLSDDAVA